MDQGALERLEDRGLESCGGEVLGLEGLLLPGRRFSPFHNTISPLEYSNQEDSS